jgi:hypothetical protein
MIYKALNSLFLDLLAVQLKPVVDELKSQFTRDFFLEALKLFILELMHFTGLKINEMVVMFRIQFEED